MFLNIPRETWLYLLNSLEALYFLEKLRMYMHNEADITGHISGILQESTRVQQSLVSLVSRYQDIAFLEIP